MKIRTLNLWTGEHDAVHLHSLLRGGEVVSAGGRKTVEINHQELKLRPQSSCLTAGNRKASNTSQAAKITRHHEVSGVERGEGCRGQGQRSTSLPLLQVQAACRKRKASGLTDRRSTKKHHDNMWTTPGCQGSKVTRACLTFGQVS